MTTATETTLSNLTYGEWSALSNTWSRGIDCVVWKAGRRWQIHRGFGFFPTYKTKIAAYDAVTALVLAESRYRASQR
jgi:hypothetical protein